MSPENNTIHRRAPFMKVLALFLFIVAATMACFAPTLYNELLNYDDAGYIVNNEHIRSLSFETVRWAFAEFYNNYWAPLTWISLALDYSLWGLNPVGYHLTNNLLHALNAGMFFLLVLQLLRNYRTALIREGSDSALFVDQHALYCALLAALHFALHPLRVESVAWATERKDVLGLFFGLPAVIFYLRAAERPSGSAGERDRGPALLTSPAYWWSVAFFALSLLSKSLLVTLPMLLLIMDWFPLKRIHRRNLQWRLFEKVPFLVLAGLVSGITATAVAPVVKSLQEIGIVTRLLIAGKAIAAYLWLTVFPLQVSPAYLHPGNLSGIQAEHLISILVLAAITAFCFSRLKHRPLYMAVWLMYVITLLPVLGLIQTGPQAMAGRFTYAAGMFISVLVALGFTAIYARIVRSRALVVLLCSAALCMLLGNSYITVRDISWWKDDVTLWTRSIVLQPNVIGRLYFNRSLAYKARGDYPKALADLDEAYAIATRKGYKGAHEILAERGRVYQHGGDLNKALAEFSLAIEASKYPDDRMYHWERGAVYQALGMTDLANDDFKQASFEKRGP